MRRNLLFVLVALAAIPAVMPSSTQQANSTQRGASVAAEFSALPKTPSWTRPSPTTWSSRPMIRWEARFGTNSLFIA